MPNEQKDVVNGARELAEYVSGLAAGLQDVKLARAPELLKTLSDEVEALREELAERCRDILNLEDEAYRNHV